jgi:hypothetical protein
MKHVITKYADPRYAKIIWALVGIIGLILAGGAPTSPSGPGG